MPPPPPPPAMPAPPSPSASAIAIRFANHWIADALAGDESLEFFVLQALLKASPEPLAGAPEATRERVALRSLHQLSSLIPAGGDADATATAGVFTVDDGARSAEAVLFRLIREVEVSGNLEEDLLPTLSQDIKETIHTKTLKLPETSFQLLKGVDPWITSVTPQSQEDTMDAVGLGTRSPERSPIVEGNTSVGTVLASAGCDAHLEGRITEPFSQQDKHDHTEPGHLPECITAQDTTTISQPDNLEDVSASIRPREKDHVHGDLTLELASVLPSISCNDANQACNSATNLQPGTATEDRMAFEEQNADKSHLELSDANMANQALHDAGSIMKSNIVHGGLTAQTAPVSQNCNVTLHDTSEANCFSAQGNEKNRTDVREDNCHNSIPSSSKDRDGESAKKTSNEENSADTSLEICVRSKDQDTDDTLEGSSPEDLCIRCGNKDGLLFKCSDCPFAAHFRCFSSSVTFEETNLFYCPACHYKKAKEAYQKAKTAFLEAEEAIAYISRPQVVKQHEQLNGVQPGAANRDGHSNGCDTSKRTHENEAYNLSHRDEESHQQRKKQKINARGHGYTKEVLTEKVPASLNVHSVLQNNSKTRADNPEKKQQAGNKEACKAGNDNSSHKRCDSPSNQDDEADQEDILTACNQTGGSDEVEGTSSNENGKRSSPPWRNMRHSQKRLHEKEPAGPSKSKHISQQDQHAPSSRRKRSSVHPQKPNSKPVAPLGRRNNLLWKIEEEDILREGMIKFAPKDGGRIPWRRILEYGKGVFDERRLACDLKDKWRNMQKEQAGY